MEVIKWASGKGLKLILSRKEAEDLQEVVRLALGSYVREAESDFFEIEIERELASP